MVVVRGILDLVEGRGAPREELLRGSTIDAAALADMRTRVSGEQLDVIASRAIDLSNDQALGLHIGEYAPESFSQIVGHVALSAPTLEEALALFTRFSPLLFSDLHFTLVRGSASAHYIVGLPDDLSALTTRFVAELLSALVARTLLARFAGGMRMTGVSFRYPRPPHCKQYEDTFGCPVKFDQPSCALEFPAAWLERGQAHADILMRTELSEVAERLLLQVGRPISTVERVRVLLRQNRELSDIDSVQVARELKMSTRVLRRKLGTEGFTLTDLREDALRERARFELLQPEANIKDIAERLGYSEPSAFHRAFKRWTGLTPSQFVRDQRRGSIAAGERSHMA